MNLMESNVTIQEIKTIIDVTSLTTVIATIIGWLPPLAALASIIWTSLQIYDWYKKRKQKNDDQR